MTNFIESIKLSDGKIFHLEYHQNRIKETLKYHLHWGNVFNLKQELKNVILPQKGLHKIRIEYNIEITDIQIIPYSISPIDTLSIIHCNYINYPFKSVDRNIFYDLKKEKNNTEIIIVKNGLITDSSFSNLVFQKNNQWYTPDSYLLNGTCRQRLLNEGKITEMKISYTDLAQFEKVGLINSMLDLEVIVLDIKKIKA